MRQIIIIIVNEDSPTVYLKYVPNKYVNYVQKVNYYPLFEQNLGLQMTIPETPLNQ